MDLGYVDRCRGLHSTLGGATTVRKPFNTELALWDFLRMMVKSGRPIIGVEHHKKLRGGDVCAVGEITTNRENPGGVEILEAKYS